MKGELRLYPAGNRFSIEAKPGIETIPLFRYNKLGISLQNGQTFLPTAKRVDYILRSQPFFMTIECSQSVHSIVYERIFYGRKHNV